MFREPAVILDVLRETDRDRLVEIHTDSTLRRFLGGGLPLDQANSRIDALLHVTPKLNWALRANAAGELLGIISLDQHHDGVDAEVSYVLLRVAQGRGIATAALRSALRHAFSTMNLHRVIAETQSANEKSIALLTRLGFSPERQLIRFGAQQTIFSINAETFFKLENSRIGLAIVALCRARSDGVTICPSEVARALWPDDWRAHMKDVRAVGVELAKANDIEITQRGIVRDPNDEIRGAIRYRVK